MSIDVRIDTTPAVHIVPGELRAALASATVRVVSPANVELATPAATVDSASAVVESVANGTEIDVDDATGFVAGGTYLLLADAGPELVEVERVDSDADRIYLAARTSDTIRAGDVLVGARVSTALTSACASELGMNHRIEWTIIDGAGDEYVMQTMYHVVTMPLPALVTPRLVRSVLRGYSGDAMTDLYGPAGIRRIATQADDRLRQMIEQLGRRPHLYGDPSQFDQCAAEAVHVILASAYTLTPGSYVDGPAEWQRLKTRSLREEFDGAIQRLGWYDEEETREPEDAPPPALRSASLLL